MNRRRESLDGAERRRVYLFRHGAVDYVDAEGNVVDDPDSVSLNQRGREEADAMHQLFSGVVVDRAVCTGLSRTRETAERVLAGRELKIETVGSLSEIRPATDRQPEYDIFADVAYSHWYANEPGRQFLGGETYRAFYDRISASLERLIEDRSWHTIAVFAHGGTNAALLGWVTGLELRAFGVVDQATCCLNVIDLDMMPGEPGVVRKVVRGMNITATDPAKGTRHSGDMEALARYLMKFKT